MDQIANTAGISRKALFLHFPSKGDLVWHRDGEYVQNLRDDIRAAGGDSATAVQHAVVAGFRNAPESLDTISMQTRLHASDPELRDIVESRGIPWRNIVSAWFIEAGADALLADVLAFGYWRAMWIGLERWQESSREMAPFLDEQLDHMTQLSRSLLQIRLSTVPRPHSTSSIAIASPG